jgi:hypothetical protein
MVVGRVSSRGPNRNACHPSEVIGDMENEIGRFVRWGEAVTVDIVKKVISFLPESKQAEIVELPEECDPSDEALGARVSSF